MAQPSAPFEFKVPMDPAELLDFEIKLRDSPQLLEVDEQYTDWTLTLYPEAAALGLQILVDPPYAPVTDGINITGWFQVLEADQENPIFDGDGVKMDMELSITTDNVPPRKRQRTLRLTVKQL